MGMDGRTSQWPTPVPSKPMCRSSWAMGTAHSSPRLVTKPARILFPSPSGTSMEMDWMTWPRPTRAQAICRCCLQTATGRSPRRTGSLPAIARSR